MNEKPSPSVNQIAAGVAMGNLISGLIALIVHHLLQLWK